MNSRKLARITIQRILNTGAYSNIVLSNVLNENEISAKDKGLITELVYGVLRRKNTIDIIISNFVRDISIMNDDILNILRVAIYQMHYLDRIPDHAILNEAVEEAKEISEKEGKLVNGILRSYQKAEGDIEIKGNKINEFEYKYSFAPWMIRLLINQYGERMAFKIMNGLNQIPSVTVRVNSIKADYDEVFEGLEELGYEVEDGYICPEAISIKNGKNIENNPYFEEGKITVQDESAMVVAPLLDLDSNDLVLDLCSAPGGKTTHIGELLENEGKVLAFDLHENKLSLIDENIKRLGLSNIELCQMDARELNSKYISCANKVLIDVPCSGLGIIRKKPEIKWSKNRKQLTEIVEIQRKIMNNAWQYLKPGGVMIYSTCTLNKEENENNIEWFLQNNKDAKPCEIYLGKQDNLVYGENKTLTILPNEHMDGFFIAKIQKK